MLRQRSPEREEFVSQRWFPMLLLALACGGGGHPAQPVPAETATTPDAAVRNFLQAVADSNITRMGRYWGTSKGPAAIVGQPVDHQQRLTVTQSFLRRSSYRIVRMDPVSSDRMTVVVDFDRKDPDGTACIRQVPFGVIQTGKYGWIVTAIDLNLAGSPVRPCAPVRPAS
jgi:hypothetical protein